jgi:hypothetical protein
MKHRVTISGKVEDDGKPRDKARQIARQEVEAANIRDAVIQGLDKAGIDGFSSGEFNIKVTQPDD